MKNDITWKIGGEAGFGIMSSGIMLSKTFSRVGYHIVAGNEYPSLIRGGHNIITVRIATEPIFSLSANVDILIALNKETVTLHKQEINTGGILLFDPSNYNWKPEELPENITAISIPLTDIVKTLGGSVVMRNTLALGATIALLGADFSLLESVISDQFMKKGEEIIKENITVAKKGFDFISAFPNKTDSCHIAPGIKKEPQLVMNASEAVGLGALSGGVEFAAIYPMTPINSLIPMFSDFGKDFHMTYIQPEDEIAGINMAIGASLAGKRSMVATSGGGFALMVEGISMTGIMEVPMVVDLGMRPGPATGMPTWTEQGELRMVIHAGHGDFPRIVLAPGDIEECFLFTREAFNLADQFQVPVFILTDKYLNENLWTISESVLQTTLPIDRGKRVTDIADGKEFKRYDMNCSDGVSPRSVPGVKNGEYIANSYEHDEKGFTIEDSVSRTKMVDKRMKKIAAIQKVFHPPTVIGDNDADITFVSFGSTKGPILEGMKTLQAYGKKVKLIHFSWIIPFPENIGAMLSREKRLVIVEGNRTAQLKGLIREYTGIEIVETLLKYDGRQWSGEEIANIINK